jgi:hypothetical protein
MPEIALDAADLTLDAATAILRSRTGSTGSTRAQTIQRHCLVLCAVAWETYSAESLLWIAETWAEQFDERGGRLPEPLAAFLDATTPKIAKEYRDRRSDKAIERAVRDGRESTVDSARITARLQREFAWLDDPDSVAQHTRLAAAVRYELFGMPFRDGGLRGGRGSRYEAVVKTQRAILAAAPLEEVRVWGDPDPRWVRENIDTLVERRNEAGHAGRERSEINGEGAADWIDFSRQLVHGLDQQLQAWGAAHELGT